MIYELQQPSAFMVLLKALAPSKAGVHELRPSPARLGAPAFGISFMVLQQSWRCSLGVLIRRSAALPLKVPRRFESVELLGRFIAPAFTSC